MRYAHPTQLSTAGRLSASFVCMVLISPPAVGVISNNGPLSPCAAGSWGVGSGGNMCATSVTGDDTGIFGFGVGQKFGPLSGGSYIGRYGLYPPYNGYYRAGLALCSGKERCTLRQSYSQLSGLREFYLTSNTTIFNQEVDAGGFPAMTLTVESAACTFLIDRRGVKWVSRDRTSCQDGNMLPEKPADCYLNNSAGLDVTLGTLERGRIATLPAAGSPGNVKKDVSVLCTRDAGTTVKTTFQYTPLTFNGHEVISAGSKGLGVAVFYKGNLVGPSSAPITETFSVGYTSREFEFQAVRDPALAPKDIPTGNFTASATMVMTQQ